mmetsp:Transcript_48185/g.79870  ORF Transcript_48185/g.79870 Transcript_48185/m.79870 type:complete len:277 (+) Transcript_48185:1088-1918(+)
MDLCAFAVIFILERKSHRIESFQNVRNSFRRFRQHRLDRNASRQMTVLLERANAMLDQRLHHQLIVWQLRDALLQARSVRQLVFRHTLQLRIRHLLLLLLPIVLVVGDTQRIKRKCASQRRQHRLLIDANAQFALQMTREITRFILFRRHKQSLNVAHFLLLCATARGRRDLLQCLKHQRHGECLGREQRVLLRATHDGDIAQIALLCHFRFDIAQFTPGRLAQRLQDDTVANAELKSFVRRRNLVATQIDGVEQRLVHVIASSLQMQYTAKHARH